MTYCLVKDLPVDWEIVVRWCTTVMHEKSLKAILCRLCLSAIVYHLWKQMNDLLHGNILTSEEVIVAQIKWGSEVDNSGYVFSKEDCQKY
jgi:hypothetical protein